MRGKINQNKNNIWYLNICKVTWLPAWKWHYCPQSTQLQQTGKQSKWNLLIFLSGPRILECIEAGIFFLLHVNLNQLVIAAHQIMLRRISTGTEECCSTLEMSSWKQKEARHCICYRSESWNRLQASLFLGLILFIPTKPKHPISG